MEQKSNAVKTLSFLVITLAVYLLLWQLLTRYFDLPVYYYARLIELLAIGLFIALALHTPMRFCEMGIVVPRDVLARSLAAGGAIALLVFTVLGLLRVRLGGMPLFSWHVSGDISRVTYILVAPLQEILAKSVMLYSFELCFEGRHPHLANLMSGLTFAAFHVVYGFPMMVLAMLLALFTGWLFLRVRCVWGCALAHFALGFLPACFGFA
ncbi:MAG: CPBP family intramembrane metalloprotease [Clostridia bacterium]|nr:CPBP family intramembrane metalloprotease [Clostridia bacterium]